VSGEDPQAATVPVTEPPSKQRPTPARRPWHAPKLTEVPLRATGDMSGIAIDGEGGDHIT